jgi:hypothetical protein
MVNTCTMNMYKSHSERKCITISNTIEIYAFPHITGQSYIAVLLNQIIPGTVPGITTVMRINKIIIKLIIHHLVMHKIQNLL